MAETAPNTAREEGVALTKILARQASVAGHVDKEDVFASVLLKGDVFLPIDGEGPVLIDGAAHTSMAVRLQDKTSTREWLDPEGNSDTTIFKISGSGGTHLPTWS